MHKHQFTTKNKCASRINWIKRTNKNSSVRSRSIAATHRLQSWKKIINSRADTYSQFKSKSFVTNLIALLCIDSDTHTERGAESVVTLGRFLSKPLIKLNSAIGVLNTQKMSHKFSCLTCHIIASHTVYYVRCKGLYAIDVRQQQQRQRQRHKTHSYSVSLSFERCDNGTAHKWKQYPIVSVLLAAVCLYLNKYFTLFSANLSTCAMCLLVCCSCFRSIKVDKAHGCTLYNTQLNSRVHMKTTYTGGLTKCIVNQLSRSRKLWKQSC